MKNYLVLFLTLTLIACGPSQEEIKRAEMEQQRIEQEAAEQLAAENSARVAAVTCAVIRETRNMDAAIRVREVNDAREKIGGVPYVLGDEGIRSAIEYGLCQDLILDNDFLGKVYQRRETRRQRLESERQGLEKRKVEIQNEFKPRIAEIREQLEPASDIKKMRATRTDLLAQKEDLEREIKRRRMPMDFLEQEIAMTRPLIETGAVSEKEIIDLTNELEQQETKLLEFQNAYHPVEESLNRVDDEIASRESLFPPELSEKLTTILQQLLRERDSKLEVIDAELEDINNELESIRQEVLKDTLYNL